MIEKKGSDIDFWDKVSAYFGNGFDIESAYCPGIENYNAIWPFLNKIIVDNYKSIGTRTAKACDFGCGTGIFSEKLAELGFLTFACDISPKMIQQASNNSFKKANYNVGGIDYIENNAPFNLIISIMVLQFVPNIKELLTSMSKATKNGGILFFAIHNEHYIEECIKNNIIFRKTDENCVVEIQIGNLWTKAYVHSIGWYDNFLSSFGLIKMAEAWSSHILPDVALKKGIINWDSPKYYMAWYKKQQ